MRERCSDSAALGTCWTIVAGACLKALVREKGGQSVAYKLCCERGWWFFPGDDEQAGSSREP